MTRYFVEPRTKKYVRCYRFLSAARNISNKYGKKFLDVATKTGLDADKLLPKTIP